MKMFEAIIEIPKFSRYKYELKNGELSIDRPLNQAIPFSYGFIPRTLCEDGDGLDVFIISEYQIESNTNVNFSPIGVFKCFDGGECDDKIIGILKGEESLFIGDDLDRAKKQIKNYLQTYKSGFEVLDFKDVDEAVFLIDDAEQNLLDKEREFF